MAVWVQIPSSALIKENIMKSELRNCGSCTFCCIVQGIKEINKPEGIKCKHIYNGGCSIYDTRPMPCRTFHCLWRFRKLFKDKKNRRRPDKLGVLIIAKKEIEGYSPALQFNTLEKGVYEKQDIKELIDNYRKGGFNVALVVAGKSKDSILLKSKK